MNKLKSILLATTAVTLLFAGLSFTGCGGGADVGDLMKQGNSTNIRRVRNCYAMYADLNKYKGPASKEELLEFLKSNGGAMTRLERMGIPQEDLDDMFVSERDGEPFKIRWGLNGVDDHACVFEAVGVEGKYMVAFATPRELEKDEYDDYFSGKLKGASPGGIQDVMEQEEEDGAERGEDEG
jgi:hypothetical protein